MGYKIVLDRIMYNLMGYKMDSDRIVCNLV